MSGPRTNPAHVMVASTRRWWSREQKRAIVAETCRNGTTVSEVARLHGVRPSLLFRWRSELVEEERAAKRSSEPAFVPLLLPGPANAVVGARTTAAIEIEIAGGHRLRADASVDPALLRSVIEALVGR